MSGGSLTTKGLVSGGGSAPAPADDGVSFPPGYGLAPATPTLEVDAQVVLTMPTAINVCAMAAENITENLRAQQPSDLVLPSLYKRAYLIAHETDEIALVRQ